MRMSKFAQGFVLALRSSQDMPPALGSDRRGLYRTRSGRLRAHPLVIQGRQTRGEFRQVCEEYVSAESSGVHVSRILKIILQAISRKQALDRIREIGISAREDNPADGAIAVGSTDRKVRKRVRSEVS